MRPIGIKDQHCNGNFKVTEQKDHLSPVSNPLVHEKPMMSLKWISLRHNATHPIGSSSSTRLSSRYLANPLKLMLSVINLSNDI